MKWYRTSAMKGTNIEEAIKETTLLLIGREKNKEEKQKEQVATKVVKLKPKEFKDNSKETKKKECC